MNPILLAFLVTCAITVCLVVLIVAIHYIGELVRYIDSRVKFDFELLFGSTMICLGAFAFIMFLSYLAITNQ